MSKIWLTSDTHFCHKNIIKYCDRPFFDVEEMNSVLIKRWNAAVAEDDVVYHLGDIYLGPADRASSLLGALNGRIILIRGNHDRHSKAWYLERGIAEMYPSLFLYTHGKCILLTHEPDKVMGENYDLHFFGHIHNDTHRGEYPIIARNGACLCVELWDYAPVALETVLDLCANALDTCPNI